ncbi:MAG: YggT family protein [Alphaproteobacteria bacterium]|nr:YggT family protein [Alphaproteobacteria bacterium]
MEILLDSILWCVEGVLQVYFMLVVVSVALYWCMHYELIGQGGETFKRFLSLLHKITEPVYAKMREKIKPVSGFDVTPYVLIFALMFVLHILSSVRMALVAQ